MKDKEIHLIFDDVENSILKGHDETTETTG